METTQEMALSLLRKWQEEERLVLASITFGKTRCMVLGRIEQLDDEQILIDGSSTEEPFGKHRGLILRFGDVLTFSFDDARLFSEQAPDIATQIESVAESFLSLDLGTLTLGVIAKSTLFALRLPSELPA
jgi:hypothetical protein